MLKIGTGNDLFDIVDRLARQLRESIGQQGHPYVVIVYRSARISRVVGPFDTFASAMKWNEANDGGLVEPLFPPDVVWP